MMARNVKISLPAINYDKFRNSSRYARVNRGRLGAITKRNRWRAITR